MDEEGWVPIKLIAEFPRVSDIRISEIHTYWLIAACLCDNVTMSFILCWWAEGPCMSCFQVIGTRFVCLKTWCVWGFTVEPWTGCDFHFLYSLWYSAQLSLSFFFSLIIFWKRNTSSKNLEDHAKSFYNDACIWFMLGKFAFSFHQMPLQDLICKDSVSFWLACHYWRSHLNLKTLQFPSSMALYVSSSWIVLSVIIFLVQ